MASFEVPSFVGKEPGSTRRKLLAKCRKEKGYVQKAFPKDGAPVPRIGDLVRTRIVCRYIDGVEFLTSKLFELAQRNALDPRRRREGRVEGYVAQHVTLCMMASTALLDSRDWSRFLAKSKSRLSWQLECGRRRIRSTKSLADTTSLRKSGNGTQVILGSFPISSAI